MIKAVISSVHRGEGRAREGLGFWGQGRWRATQRDSGQAPKLTRQSGAWAKAPRAARQHGWGQSANGAPPGQGVRARAVGMLTGMG